LPSSLDVCAVHLPGRESRVAEPPGIDIAELAQAIAHRAGDQPFAVFGHSMGARLGFEVARELRRTGQRLPRQLFVSGCRPPHMDIPLKRIARLSDDEFCDKLAAMGGTPPGVFASAELRALVLPVLRADFVMVESYRYRPEPPLPVPIVAFAGAHDPEADPCDVAGWAGHSTQSTRQYTLPGEHFFLHSERAELHRMLSAHLGGTPSRDDELAEDEVFVIDARLDELPELCAAVGELSPSEERRVGSFRRPRDADRFVGRSALLRRTLRRFGVDLGLAEFKRGAGGKPVVPGLQFNATHSDGVALVAVTAAREVGIDVERRVAMRDLDAFLDGGLDDDERTEFSYLPDDELLDAALHTWTAKESVLKATGDGLAVDPSAFGFADQHGRVWRAETRPGYERLAGWRVRHLELAGAIGAVALETGDWRLRYETWRGGTAGTGHREESA
jgi:surfactin synthase thioesterase subunit/phosphopantetheinyl transferase